MMPLLLAAALTASAPQSPEALEQKLAHQGWSSTALADLGDTWAQAGHPGRAILAYERARLLDPRDAHVKAELAKERQTAGVASPPPSSLERIASLLSPDEWLGLAIAAAALSALGLIGIGWSFMRSLSRALAIGGAIAAATTVMVAVWLAPSPGDAIVVQSEVARIAPFDKADVAFSADEGAAVRIEQQRGDWLYVRDRDQTGWLPKSALERIVAADST
jgi:hypothetical protein